MKKNLLFAALIFKLGTSALAQTVVVADAVARPTKINRQILFIKPNGALFAMPRIGAAYELGLSATDRIKFDGIEAGANNYTHPSTHPASLIVQDAASNRT